MINLIPPSAKKDVKIEYWIRVISVWIILVAVAGIIVGVLLVPTFVLVQAQLVSTEDSYRVANIKNDSYDLLEEEVRVANEVATHLLDTGNPALFSAILAELEIVAGQTVELDSIAFSRKEGRVETVAVRGNAPLRSSLVTFRDALEAREMFLSVELPLSNFAKDKDVAFSIEIMINSEIYNEL